MWRQHGLWRKINTQLCRAYQLISLLCVLLTGIRTPMPIALLKDKMPEVYKELHDTVKMLEKHMKDMQDTEFTVQDGRLFMLQTRNGKRTGQAALKIALDMEKEVSDSKSISVCETGVCNVVRIVGCGLKSFQQIDKILGTKGHEVCPWLQVSSPGVQKLSAPMRVPHCLCPVRLF